MAPPRISAATSAKPLALLNDPALRIADEPTTALDATVQLQILALLARGAVGRATVLITHDLGVAAGLCHRILVMCEGRITGELTAGEATQERIMTFATQRESIAAA